MLGIPSGLMENNREESDSNRQGESSDEAEIGNAGVKSEQLAWDWDSDIENPYDWPAGQKAWQVAMISSSAFLA